MRIERHEKSHIVQLDDGSRWRIWPGDLGMTLGWKPDTKLSVIGIDDQFCSHALVDHAEGTRVRVISADEHWHPTEVARSMMPKPDAGDDR